MFRQPTTLPGVLVLLRTGHRPGDHSSGSSRFPSAWSLPHLFLFFGAEGLQPPVPRSGMFWDSQMSFWTSVSFLLSPVLPSWLTQHRPWVSDIFAFISISCLCLGHHRGRGALPSQEAGCTWGPGGLGLSSLPRTQKILLLGKNGLSRDSPARCKQKSTQQPELRKNCY